MTDHPFTLHDAWGLSMDLSFAMAGCPCEPTPAQACCAHCLCLVNIVAAGMAHAALCSLEEVPDA